MLEKVFFSPLHLQEFKNVVLFHFIRRNSIQGRIERRELKGRGIPVVAGY